MQSRQTGFLQAKTTRKQLQRQCEKFKLMKTGDARDLQGRLVARFLQTASIRDIADLDSLLPKDKVQAGKLGIFRVHCGRCQFFPFLSLYLTGLLLGKVTKTAFPCCLAVAFFMQSCFTMCVEYPRFE